MNESGWDTPGAPVTLNHRPGRDGRRPLPPWTLTSCPLSESVGYPICGIAPSHTPPSFGDWGLAKPPINGIGDLASPIPATPHSCGLAPWVSPGFAGAKGGSMVPLDDETGPDCPFVTMGLGSNQGRGGWMSSLKTIRQGFEGNVPIQGGR